MPDRPCPVPSVTQRKFRIRKIRVLLQTGRVFTPTPLKIEAFAPTPLLLKNRGICTNALKSKCVGANSSIFKGVGANALISNGANNIHT
jgi:hypothetical protein